MSHTQLSHTQQQGLDRVYPPDFGVLFLLRLDLGLETAALLAASKLGLGHLPSLCHSSMFLISEQASGSL